MCINSYKNCLSVSADKNKIKQVCTDLLTKSALVHIYSASKKSSTPKKLFAVFSLLVNLCNWKLPWLLPKHISMPTTIFIHLSEFLKMYHFYQCDLSNFKNSVSLLQNSWIFRKNTSHIKWYLIKYNNWYLLYELSHYMFKISTVGWQTYLQSIAVVFHRVLNGFLRQGRTKQLKCICKLGNCF